MAGVWGGRAHPSVFSRKTNWAEVGNAPLAGPLSWGCCPGAGAAPAHCGKGLHVRVPGLGAGRSAVSARAPTARRGRSGPRRAWGAGPQPPASLCLLPAAERCPRRPCCLPLQDGPAEPGAGSWLQPFPSGAGAGGGHPAGPTGGPQGRAALPHLGLR